MIRSVPCNRPRSRSWRGRPLPFSACFTAALGWITLGGAVAGGAETVTFERDVMAVFSKAGCNSGACHGNQNGKGGFRLSLRGQDPGLDYQSLVREHGGRRLNPLDPESSLMLLKPTGKVAHEGGVRFGRNGLEYAVLRGWIRSGARGPGQDVAPVAQLLVRPSQQVLFHPLDRVQLQVTAVYSDGTQRDVTDMAVYETTNLGVTVAPGGLARRQSFGETTIMVRYLNQQVPVQLAFVPERPDFVWDDPAENNFIDRHVFAKLRSLRMNPSPLAEDHVFLRRAMLDALGVLPTAQESQQFAADPHPDKRSRLIDYLLSRPEFADHWALKWSDVLRNEEKVLDETGVAVFHQWIRDSVAVGKPLDQFVRELLTGLGSTYENPAANFYRANRDSTTRAETAARLFLGTRLQCARCHNHPFDRWTQDDYYSWAAVFARVDYEIVKNERRDKLDLNEFNGEQIVKLVDKGEVDNPRTGSPAQPKLLGARPLEVGTRDDRLIPMAVWLTSEENQAFAQAQVNFIWYHLMGRGLVEPIDDFRSTNPANHPPLLEALARDFSAHRFDLRHVVRTIMNSSTYQLSAVPNDSNADDTSGFSRAVVYRLPAEKLLDAQCQVLDAPASFAGYPLGIRGGQLPGVRKPRRRGEPMPDGDRFLKSFGKPERLLACECERSNETTLAQAFVLIGGEGLHERLRRPNNRLEQMARSSMTNQQLIVQLYWTALGRPPEEDELRAALELFDVEGGFTTSEQQAWGRLFTQLRLLDRPLPREAALQDLAWALLNSKEFVFRW